MTLSPKSGRPDVAALARAGDRKGLRLALEDPEAAIRARAADALAKLGDLESVRLLRRALRLDPDEHVREEAAVALGRLRDVGAADDLIAVLEHDRCAHVREEAALALGRLGDNRAIGALLDAMDDRYTMVHRAAARGPRAHGPGCHGAPGRARRGPAHAGGRRRPLRGGGS